MFSWYQVGCLLVAYNYHLILQMAFTVSCHRPDNRSDSKIIQLEIFKQGKNISPTSKVCGIRKKGRTIGKSSTGISN